MRALLLRPNGVTNRLETAVGDRMLLRPTEANTFAQLSELGFVALVVVRHKGIQVINARASSRHRPTRIRTASYFSAFASAMSP